MSAPSSTKGKASIPAWASLATGATSGLASCLLLQPMDLLKTRLQQESRQRRREAQAQADALQVARPGEPPRRARPLLETRTVRLVRTIKTIYAQDGPRGFWRGTAPTVARNVPGVALYFYSVSELRAIVARRRIRGLSIPSPLSPRGGAAARGPDGSALAKLSTGGNLLTGAVARVAVGFILSPVTVVKAKMESSHARQHYSTMRGSVRHMFAEGGVRSFYQGFGATALRDAPYAGIYLALYEWTKGALGGLARGRRRPPDAHGEQQQQLAWIASASGVAAGTLATVITHPFDIIKTRLQTQPSPALVHTTLGMARKIIAKDGMQAFVDGLGLRCARKAASSAIAWTIFELGTKAWLARLT